MDDEAIVLDPITYSSFYVELLYKTQVIGSGTCFFVKRNEKTYLVTNWHVVTGRNPQNGQLTPNLTSGPDQLKVSIYKDQDNVERIDIVVNLYSEDGNPLWKEHPEFHRKVDVVLLEFSIPEGLIVKYIEDCIEFNNENTKVGIADDVFVVGFPFGLSVADQFPIWKRASIASEPIIDAEDLPLIYIDTASRPGMSGSPVIFRKQRPISIINGDKISRYYMCFVGIYSGRIGENKDLTVQLGKVWKANVIDEILA